jgi:hypothetical protein
MMIGGAGLAMVSGVSSKKLSGALLRPSLTTTKLPSATTSTAAAARHAARLYHLTGSAAGTTPLGT